MKLWYKTDKDLSLAPMRYKKPFWVRNTTELTAFAEFNSKTSKVIGAVFLKHPHLEWKIKLHSKYNAQYTAGGDDGIIDGIRGDLDWRKGGWQGYQGQDAICDIDIGKNEFKNEVRISVLEDSRSWIYYPREIRAKVSVDGKNWLTAGKVLNEKNSTEMIHEKQELVIQFPPQTSFRFVRIHIVNYGKLPDWHLSAGEDAFIFVDEIEIR